MMIKMIVYSREDRRRRVKLTRKLSCKGRHNAFMHCLKLQNLIIAFVLPISVFLIYTRLSHDIKTLEVQTTLKTT